MVETLAEVGIEHKTLWFQQCFDNQTPEKNLTVPCPSVMVALTQMSGFRGTGLGAGGVQSWNLLPCGP